MNLNKNIMKNQKAVFEFGNEYNCTEFYDVDINAGRMGKCIRIL